MPVEDATKNIHVCFEGTINSMSTIEVILKWWRELPSGTNYHMELGVIFHICKDAILNNLTIG